MRAADAAEAHTQGAPEQGSRVAQLVGAEKGQLWPGAAPGPYPEPRLPSHSPCSTCPTALGIPEVPSIDGGL